MSALEPAFSEDIRHQMLGLGEAARAAAQVLATAPAQAKDKALKAAAAAIRTGRGRILAANAKDLAEAEDLSAALRDRLELDDDRIEAMASGLEEIARLADPVGRVMK